MDLVAVPCDEAQVVSVREASGHRESGGQAHQHGKGRDEGSREFHCDGENGVWKRMEKGWRGF